MGMLQKKCRATAKKARAYRGKAGQNTDIAFLALRLGVVLCMGKTGTIWQFFRALFPSTWRTLSPDALFTRIWDTRKHPESATFSCFPR